MASGAKKGNSRAVDVPVPQDQYASVSVRKIANGYLVCESVSGPKGYKSTERFSPTKPKITMPSAAAPKPKR